MRGGVVCRYVTDFHSRTPMHVALTLGNLPMVEHILKRSIEALWIWGPVYVYTYYTHTHILKRSIEALWIWGPVSHSSHRA